MNNKTRHLFVAAAIAAAFGLLGLGRTAGADEADDLLKQAKTLEARAERLLDDGRRPEAFRLLGRVADLRERARRMRHGAVQPAGKAPAKAKAQPATPQEALKRLEVALTDGDVARARQESARLRAALARSEARTRAREQAVERRVRALEAQINELKRLLR